MLVLRGSAEIWTVVETGAPPDGAVSVILDGVAVRIGLADTLTETATVIIEPPEAVMEIEPVLTPAGRLARFNTTWKVAGAGPPPVTTIQGCGDVADTVTAVVAATVRVRVYVDGVVPKGYTSLNEAGVGASTGGGSTVNLSVAVEPLKLALPG